MHKERQIGYKESKIKRSYLVKGLGYGDEHVWSYLMLHAKHTPPLKPASDKDKLAKQQSVVFEATQQWQKVVGPASEAAQGSTQDDGLLGFLSDGASMLVRSSLLQVCTSAFKSQSLDAVFAHNICASHLLEATCCMWSCMHHRKLCHPDGHALQCTKTCSPDLVWFCISCKVCTMHAHPAVQPASAMNKWCQRWGSRLLPVCAGHLPYCTGSGVEIGHSCTCSTTDCCPTVAADILRHG